ncbi:heavy metal translocating P-type ATPase [Devosia sp. ZB163]|uniref:heavy metal translocating P-type ATPase n=1 Tax=Devosia sp. ZB163 TaxID=3025938 RepID=UPI0023623175|nr:heavy metal translocating P-type ATPase [Devosia sp. ZB163]MDC9823784.1 heavy metal translocating P-type ATPase [Devosia sp. ZB163]
MTCCVPGAHSVIDDPSAIEADSAALLSLSRPLGDGRRQLEFAVPDAHCAACIRSIETALLELPQVATARVNLTARRVRIAFDPAVGNPAELAPAIRASGYHTYVLDPAQETTGDPVLGELIRALGVAGFAAGNIMLFSVSVWSGANEATRDLFHWISAIIALPAVAYSGRIFFRSAWRALRVGKTNMDVPISIGVILATALSLFETMQSGRHAYFDASTSLLFFLLIGRTLDHLMRERARSAITGLARLQPRGATRIHDDGRREYLRLDEIAPGMRLEIKGGERVPVDATVVSDGAAFDYSIISGETALHAIPSGGEVVAGANNLGGPVLLQATRASTDSFLARMAAMMDAAENARTRPRRIADRAAAIYAPVVHTIAITTFLGWGLFSGDWHAALLNAVAVLIITCPCALALAVPIVHVVAAGKLFERGILMKDGAALERAAEVTSVAFDKTGTLTIGQPQVVESHAEDGQASAIAAALASASNHPLSRALSAQLGTTGSFAGSIEEVSGRGVEGKADGVTWRLGSREWCGLPEDQGSDLTEVWLTANGAVRARYRFSDLPRPTARASVTELERMGLPARLISGDRQGPVDAIATVVGIGAATGGLRPEQKVEAVADGHTMMVGDGINDAPALRAAYVSMAPTSAADIGRSAADFVFSGEDLGAVPFVIRTAKRAARLVSQNLFLAIGYNAIAVPLAICGLVTPLVAAVAMSSSSIIVVANALRLRFDRRPVVPKAAQDRLVTQETAA